jgi:hypothetical protein
MRHQSGGGNEVLLGEDRLRHHGMLGVDGLGNADGGGHVAERHLVGGVRHADGLRHPLHHGGDGGVGMALHGAVGEIAAEAVRLDDGAVEAGGADEGGGGDDAAMDVAAGKDDTQCNENLQEETHSGMGGGNTSVTVPWTKEMVNNNNDDNNNFLFRSLGVVGWLEVPPPPLFRCGGKNRGEMTETLVRKIRAAAKKVTFAVEDTRN